MFEVFGFTVSKVSVILFVVAVGFGLTVVVWRQVWGYGQRNGRLAGWRYSGSSAAERLSLEASSCS